jgi:archaeosine-15-forming tRNA-guanine transglycosylase
MDEVLRRRRGNRHKRSEVHQEAAVALQTDDTLFGPAERQAQRVRGIEPHRAHRKVVERAFAELEPVDGGTVGRDHNLVGDMPRKRAETLVSLHHAAEGLRPIKRASGCDVA